MSSWVVLPRTSGARRCLLLVLLLVSALFLFALTGGRHPAAHGSSGHRVAAASTSAATVRVAPPAHHHPTAPRSAVKDAPILPARTAALGTPAVMRPSVETAGPGPQVAAGPPYLARGP